MQRTLGQRIIFYRERLGLTQKELAQKLNIGKSTMSQYESDKRRPSDEIKLQLCEIFSISLDELLGREVPAKADDEKVSAKDQRDLNKFLQQSEVMFDGELHHLDEEGREMLRDALKYAFWQAKEKNKRKPKK